MMQRRIVSKILQSDETADVDVDSVESLVKTVLKSKVPHLYYSFLQTLDKETPESKEHCLCQNGTESPKDIWIFGYGSLIWKADFPFVDRLPGFIVGYERRFYQNSIDHRGTRELPGRVVTLVPSKDENAKVYGVAFRIAEPHIKDVLNHLDCREQNGYDRCRLPCHIIDSSMTVNVLMYVANSQNDSYAGNISEESKIAEQIYRAVGPSGFNREYVYKLSEAMTSLFPGIQDHHLENLVVLLRKKEELDKKALEKLLGKINEALSKEENDHESVENEVVSLILSFIDINK